MRKKLPVLSNDSSGLMLFHGSTVSVEYIDLSKSRPKLDFGMGFYTTTSYEQAVRWSELKYKRSTANNACKVVSRYSVISFDGLLIKNFLKPDRKWLEFVVNNRLGTIPHKFDIVIGPIANDMTLLVVNAYMNNLYGVGDAAADMAISLLKPEMLENQYAFCTEKAILTLKYEGSDFI